MSLELVEKINQQFGESKYIFRSGDKRVTLRTVNMSIDKYPRVMNFSVFHGDEELGSVTGDTLKCVVNMQKVFLIRYSLL